MSNAIVSVRGLGYRYPGSAQPVLDGLEFQIGPGEVFGFLGPNGSGKSTTQKVLTRILEGYRGEVRVFGEDLRTLTRDYYNHIGVCFEFPNLYEKLTAEENLGFYRGFFDVPTDAPAAMLERLDLPVGDKRTVGQYSKGMRMRLVLARSLLNRPRLWFLDEPTNGQDPEHQVEIRRLIRERADAGTTVFLTTHDMTVADKLCDRVAFIVEGRLVAIDAPRRLKLRRPRRSVRVERRTGPGDDAPLEAIDYDLRDPAQQRAFTQRVEADDFETLHTLEPSLEEIFLEITGRGLA